MDDLDLWTFALRSSFRFTYRIIVAHFHDLNTLVYALMQTLCCVFLTTRMSFLQALSLSLISAATALTLGSLTSCSALLTALSRS